MYLLFDVAVETRKTLDLKVFFSIPFFLVNKNQTATNQWIFFPLPFNLRLSLLNRFMMKLFPRPFTFEMVMHISKTKPLKHKKDYRGKHQALCGYILLSCLSFFFCSVFQFDVVCCGTLRFNYFPFKHSCHNGYDHRQIHRLVAGTCMCISPKDNQHLHNIIAEIILISTVFFLAFSLSLFHF